MKTKRIENILKDKEELLESNKKIVKKLNEQNKELSEEITTIKQLIDLGKKSKIKSKK